MIFVHFSVLFLLSLQVFANESLLELKGKVEDVIRNKGLTCYVCTSYLPQCNGTVDNSQQWVPHMLCKGKCFVRVGEEKSTALYRGCTDGWNKVDELDFDYVGCRNHTWNGVARTWCLCDTDRCNGESLESIAGYKSKSSYPSKNRGDDVYPVNAVESNSDANVAVVSNFKDYNHAYDENIAYSDKGQYYDENVYDDDSYVDPVKYERIDSKNEKKEHKPRLINLIYPSALPHDENTLIQEDEEEYVKPKKERKSDEREDVKEYTDYGYDDAANYKNQGPESHHTIEEYKPKKRSHVRTYRSETRSEKYEGKDRGHTGHVREESISYRDNQGRDYPLYSQDKTFSDIDQVHYDEGNEVYLKEKDKKPYHPDVPKPFWERLYPDDFVPDAYYPYGHEIPVFDTKEDLEDEPTFVDISTTPVPPSTTQPPPTKLAFNPTTDYMLRQGSNTDHPMPGERVFCSETGFYQHPTDCSAFIACTIDDHVSKPVMNHMRCPKGLFWDNTRHTCDYYSSTCKDSDANKISSTIDLGDYDKASDKDDETEHEKTPKKDFTSVVESQGYEQLHDASFESEKAYFRK